MDSLHFNCPLPAQARISGICRFCWPALRPTVVLDAHLFGIVCFSFDRPAPSPVSSHEYPFSLSLGCRCCVASPFYLAGSIELSVAPSHLPLVASTHKPPDGVLVEVGSRLQACLALVWLSLSPSLQPAHCILGYRGDIVGLSFFEWFRPENTMRIHIPL